jgi:hypothetical protein
LQFDGMKRILAAQVILLLLLPALPPAGAVQTREHWDADRSLKANLTVPAALDIVVGPGVNISFEPDLNAGYSLALELDIAGGLEVCGTSERQAAFRCSNESLFTFGIFGAYITIEGNGDPKQIAVQNCSFDDLSISLDATSGQFRDCSFNTTSVYINDSTMVFINCSFLHSTMSILNPATLNQTRLSRCTFGSPAADGWEPPWGYIRSIAAIKVSGYVAIEDCIISGYGTGIESSSGLPVITGCLVKDCEAGITLETTDPADTPLVEDCVMENCTSVALFALGNMVLRNCTLASSMYGLILGSYDPDRVPNWTLSGNRIFGNEMYGITLWAGDVLPGDTRFDDGAGHTNALGRIAKYDYLNVFISTRGSVSLSGLVVNVTDASGNLTESFRSNDMMFPVRNMVDYSVDNTGQRKDYYPYKVRADWNGIYCETTVSAGTRNVTLVLAVLPDLVPFEITLDPPSPRAGDWVVISCAVNNAGPTPSTRVQALFTLDGIRLDQTELFAVGARSNSTVRAVDWKARQGSHTVTVWLDPLNVLEENDESNNNFTFNFTVGEPSRHPAGVPGVVYAGGAVAALIVLAVAGGYLVRRRRRRGGGA